jgi:hypothetical protein
VPEGESLSRLTAISRVLRFELIVYVKTRHFEIVKHDTHVKRCRIVPRW